MKFNLEFNGKPVEGSMYKGDTGAYSLTFYFKEMDGHTLSKIHFRGSFTIYAHRDSTRFPSYEVYLRRCGIQYPEKDAITSTMLHKVKEWCDDNAKSVLYSAKNRLQCDLEYVSGFLQDRNAALINLQKEIDQLQVEKNKLASQLQAFENEEDEEDEYCKDCGNVLKTVMEEGIGKHLHEVKQCVDCNE